MLNVPDILIILFGRIFMRRNLRNLNKKRLFIGLFFLISISFIFKIDFSFAIGTNNDNTQVFVMYAGSLTKIFEEEIGPQFQNKSGYTFLGEGKGSVLVSNLIRDGFRQPDVFVSAGTIPIMNLMETNPPLAEWLIRFGSAEIVIAYSTNTPYYNDLENVRKGGDILWYNIISKEGFKLGRTDPELDPKGYYAIITGKLANIYYNDSSIKERIFGEDRNIQQLYPEELLNTILELGRLDAIIAYKHEAISRGLQYITLPKEINLSDPNLINLYDIVNHTLEYDNTVIHGEPIFFVVTIPQTVKNLDGALSFVKFLLSEEAILLLKNQGLNTMISQFGINIDKIPTFVNTSNYTMD